jgi:hypothetical protein
MSGQPARIPRSSRAKARLVHYFALVGLPEEVAVKKKAFARRDSGVQISPVDDIAVIGNGEPIPDGYDAIETTAGGRSADLNKGSLMGAKPMFIVYSRNEGKKPLTGLDLMTSKEHSKPRAGFAPAAKGQFRKGLTLMIEKNAQKDAIIGIALIQKDEDEKCPVDFVEIPIDISSGAIGASVFRLCFRTSVAQRTAYEAKILDRYPARNHPDYKFPQIITEFCFPQAIRCSTDVQFPRFFSFVFTDEGGNKNYGCCLQFWEQLTDRQLSALEKLKQLPMTNKTLYAPKCIVLLSHWPYYEQFKAFLVQLHRIVMSPSYLPFERYLEALLYSVPVPHPASIFKYKIGHKNLEFKMSPLFNYPLRDMELQQIFECLDIPTIVSIFEELLLENKVILYSNHLGMLNPVAEALRTLLYPFEWHSVYIPVLPMLLVNAIQAPFPFLVGMHRNFFDEVRVNEDVTLVDLDRNHIRYGTREEDPPVHKILPKALREQLIEELSQHSNIYEKGDKSKDADDPFAPPQPIEADEEKIFNSPMIRFVFLKFFVSILESYADFIHPGKICSFIPPGKTHEEPFYNDDYLKNCPPENQEMMHRILGTQYFQQFISDRISDDIPFECIFFDFCISWSKWDADEFADRVLAVTSKDFIPKQNIHVIRSVESEMKESKEAHDSNSTIVLPDPNVAQTNHISTLFSLKRNRPVS